LERSLQAREIGRAEDDAVPRRDVEEIEVDPGPGDLARQVGEDAGAILDLDDDHLAFAADGELREGERMPGGLRMRDEDVQLDPIRDAEARRSSEIDTCVADRGGDASESARLVLELYDQVVRNRRASSRVF